MNRFSRVSGALGAAMHSARVFGEIAGVRVMATAEFFCKYGIGWIPDHRGLGKTQWKEGMPHEMLSVGNRGQQCETGAGSPSCPWRI